MNLSPYQKERLFGSKKVRDGTGKNNPWFACLMRPWENPHVKVPISPGVPTFSKNYTDSFSLDVNTLSTNSYTGNASFRWCPMTMFNTGTIHQYYLGSENLDPVGNVTPIETGYTYSFLSSLWTLPSVYTARVVAATARFKYIGPSVLNSGYVLANWMPVVSNTPISSKALAKQTATQLFRIGHDFCLRWVPNNTTNQDAKQFFSVTPQGSASGWFHVKLLECYGNSSPTITQSLAMYHVTFDVVIEVIDNSATLVNATWMSRYTLGTTDYDQYHEALELAHKAGWFQLSPYPSDVIYKGGEGLKFTGTVQGEKEERKDNVEEEFVEVRSHGRESSAKVSKNGWLKFLGSDAMHDEL